MRDLNEKDCMDFADMLDYLWHTRTCEWVDDGNSGVWLAPVMYMVDRGSPGIGICFIPKGEATNNELWD